MRKPTTNPTMDGIERHWLHRYGWLMALLGLSAGLIIGTYCWAAILLDARYAPAVWPIRLPQTAWAVGLGLSCLPVLWWLGLRLESQRGTALRRWPVAPFLAVMVVAGAELGFRSLAGQSLFWQAVRARAGDQHLAREISLLREARAVEASQGENAAPGLVLLGSSQMVFGIEPASLSAQTGLPVYRRAVAGLFLSELVASQGLVDFHRGNRVVMLLSGFDLGARDSIYADAMRPVATPRGVGNLLAAAPAGLRWPLWRTWIDMGFAAVFDLWRSRDYYRFLLENPFTPHSAANTAAAAENLQTQRSAYENLGRNPQMVALCRAALGRFFQDMSGRCRQIVVFEGRVHPAYPAPAYESLSADMRAFLQEQQARGRIRYVTIAEQQLELSDSAWLDMSHVNSSGRELYTRMFARVLGDAASAP